MNRAKRKLHIRALAVLLVLVNLFTVVPLPSHSAENNEAVVQTGAASFAITLDGVSTGSMTIYSYEKKEISVEGSATADAYQWQILHPKKPDMWINIYDATAGYLSVTLALVKNMLDGSNTTQLRCRVTAEGVEYYTAPLTVVYSEEDDGIPVVLAEPTEPVIPETTVPETTIPETTVPETTVPETTVPETTVPETIVPETTVPETTVPETTVPETTVPETTVPETTVPAETVPAETAAEAPMVFAAPKAAASATMMAQAVPAAEEPAAPTGETTPVEETVPEAENTPALLAEGETEELEFVTVTINYIRYDFAMDEEGKLKEDADGNPVLEGDDTASVAFTSYIATLQHGTPLNTTVPSPTMVGYDRYLGDSTVAGSGDSVAIALDSVTQNVTYTVKYKPAKVPYTVRYYFQNIYDDLYVEDTTQKATVTGYTGATPDTKLIKKEFPGFLSLYYQPDFIAADGSTVFEVYYERNYYLMEFDCDGGYGAETLYVRYGSYISVPNPVKAGWTFAGWDLERSDDPDGFTYVAGKDDLPATMPCYNTAYKALWATTDTTYTVVYWAENANDYNYSYWGYQTFKATSTQTRSGVAYGNNTDTVATDEDDNLLQDITQITGQQSYFTFNSEKSDKDVIIEGDGSTVLNVYYTRNVYTVQFEARGKCAMKAHTHTDACKGTVCGYVHTHNENCTKSLTCGSAKHTAHTADCIACGYAEHTHSDSCYGDLICTETSHSHTDSGCTLNCKHTHSLDCYSTNGGSLRETDKPDENLTHLGNGIYTYTSSGWFGESTHYYLNIDEKWYCAAENIYEDLWYETDTSVISFSCNHLHTDECYSCGKTEGTHIHSIADGCYELTCTKTAHTHTNSCYKDVIHIHDNSCYTYSCGEDSHVHTDSCYANTCGIIEHTHTSSCSDTSSKIVYTITGKYEQDIRSHFPIVGELDSSDYTGYWWEVPNGSQFFEEGMNIVSIDSIPGENITFTGEYKGDDAKIFYYLETLGNAQGTTEDGYRQYNNEWYKLHKTITTVKSGYLTEKEEFHDIPGFTKGEYTPEGIFSSYPGVQAENYLYYTRNDYTLQYYNYNKYYGDSMTVEYQTPLNSDAYKVKVEELPYPDTLEPNAYEFAGWYTTAGCYDGTEVDWETITMPAGDLTLYAKWTPVVRDVIFYTLYDDIGKENGDEGYDPDLMPFAEAYDVPHGSTLGTAYNHNPSEVLEEDGTPVDDRIDGYTFIGWFYIDEDNKKRFAPDTMKITRDLKLFAEWTTSIDTTYEIQYVLAEDVLADNTPSKTAYSKGEAVADRVYAHSSAGKTKTFTAKGMGELYTDFQTGFFPTVNSHSILMQPEGEENTYTFEYVYDPIVYYKVRYRELSTNKVLHEDVVKSSEKAIVTEKFLPIAGYIPQNYYIRKTLASDGTKTEDDTIMEENIITFYYTQDKDHGLYSIEYYLEYLDSNDPTNLDNYYMYESKVGSADLGTRIEAVVRAYDGYTYQPEYNTVINYTTSEGTDEDGNKITVVTEVKKKGSEAGNPPYGKVDNGGLTIKLYYKRNQYDYQVQYRESGTEKILDTVKTGKASFDATIEHTAPEEYVKDGVTYEYYLPNATDAQRTKEKTIRAFADGEENPNILIFYYSQKMVEVQYHAVCLDANVAASVQFGGVSINAESAISANSLSGSNATPATGFEFKGWYKDADCTVPVDATWQVGETLLKPQELYQDGDWINHYYALFEPVKKNLTIQKDGSNLGDDTFLFTVTGTNVLDQEVNITVSIQGKGEVTIKDLYCGTYTVTEMTDWSWAYRLDSTNGQEVTLTVNGDDGKVTFTNEPKAVDWLHGETSKENQFEHNS